jgi:hypothetical protein
MLLTARERYEFALRKALERLHAHLELLMEPFAERTWLFGVRLQGWISDERGDVADENDRCFVVAYDDAMWEIENAPRGARELQALARRVEAQLIGCLEEVRAPRLPRAARMLPWVLQRFGRAL